MRVARQLNRIVLAWQGYGNDSSIGSHHKLYLGLFAGKTGSGCFLIHFLLYFEGKWQNGSLFWSKLMSAPVDNKHI
jgi:hypothetical protein